MQPLIIILNPPLPIVNGVLTFKRNQKFCATAFVILLAISSVIMAFEPAAAAPKANGGLLDPKTIPKYVNQLVANIPVYTPTNITNGDEVIRQDYTIDMTYFREQILPSGTPLAAGADGKTTVWGYAGNAYDAVTGQNLGYFENSPSATFLATTGIPSKVTWVNKIDAPQFLPVDNTIMWADPNGDGTTNTPVPLVPHLHGAEVQSNFDGGPNAWFTYDGIHGPTYSTYEATAANSAVYYYPNAQNPTTLWYHDHALGMTRLNVMSGLAGFYLLKDPLEETITKPESDGSDFDQYLNQNFQYGVNEIPLAIQDRSFYANGELWFPTVGVNPTIHPAWMPEFFGNTIMVNGKVWPNLDVTQGVYRFRVLDGSNARFYTLSFDNKMPFTVIGTEGGYLQKPAVVKSLTIAPGERYDIIVDFSAVAVGTKIIMTNDAKTPFPKGATADPQTTGQVMQFTVSGSRASPGTAANNIGAATAPTYPANLNPTLPGTAFPTLPVATLPRRYITLVEIMGPAGPQMVTINGQTFEGTITENPKAGTEEEWVIINLTADTHPIHTHLASFQLLSRQPLQATKYIKDWMTLNGNQMLPFPDTYAPTSLPPTAYLQQKPTPPLPTEMGWKDVVQMNPGEVTTIRIRFSQQDSSAYPFDPTVGPGYVWHCHIVDHEDNEMMRPYIVT